MKQKNEASGSILFTQTFIRGDLLTRESQWIDDPVVEPLSKECDENLRTREDKLAMFSNVPFLMIL